MIAHIDAKTIVLLLIIILAAMQSKGFVRKVKRNSLMKELTRIESLKDPKQKGREFEVFVAELLKRSGHTRVKVSPPTADGGRDVDSRKNGLDYAWEAKCWRYNDKDWRTKVGENVLRSVCAHAWSREHRKPKKPCVITTSYFSKKARRYGEINDVIMIDRDALIKLIRKVDK